MYAPGHVGLALLSYAPLGAASVRRSRHRLAVAGLVVVTALATLPDLDLYVPLLAHRGVTHTVWFALGVGLALVLAVRAWDESERAVLVGGLGLLALLAHLAGDVVTPMGLRPFAPLVDTHYTLSLVKSRNPSVNRTLFGLGASAMLVAVGPAVEADLTAGRLPEQAFRYAREGPTAAGRRPTLQRTRAVPATAA